MEMRRRRRRSPLTGHLNITIIIMCCTSRRTHTADKLLNNLLNLLRAKALNSNVCMFRDGIHRKAPIAPYIKNININKSVYM